MMSRPKNAAFALLLSLFAGSALTGTAQLAYAQDEQPAQPAQEAQNKVSAEVGKPLQEAQALMKDKKYQEALAKLDSITKEPKTPYETYAIDRTRVAIASLTGDDKVALEVLPRVIDSGQLTPDEKLKFIQATAGVYGRMQNYKQASAWLERYFKEGGNDPQARDELIRTYYAGDDFVHAGEQLKIQLDAEEKAGTAPKEMQLRILVSIAAKQNDKAGYVTALERTVKYYPKKEYWLDLLNRMQAKPTFSDRLSLDYYRLKFSMGLLASKAEYNNMAELAIRAGFASEAKKVLEAGYASKVLGDGPEFAEQKQLLAQATKESASELKSIAQTEAEVRKSKDGLGLINVGYSYVTNDQFDKGLGMMEQGLSAGGLKRQEEAKLHLGTAYVLAGRNDNAIKVFSTVQGSDGTADLARYWVMQLTNPMH